MNGILKTGKEREGHLAKEVAKDMEERTDPLLERTKKKIAWWEKMEYEGVIENKIEYKEWDQIRKGSMT